MVDANKLSRRERQIMDIVYTHRAVTAGDVLAAMGEGLSRTTVRTQLRTLEEKGFLSHEQAGREYVYRPTKRRATAGRSAMKRVVDTFFEGSLGQAVGNYLADPKSNLTPDEIERLSQLIERARANGETK